LWRLDQLSGAPALANPQALYTHPLHALFALYPPEKVVGLVIWVEMLLAALGAYAAAGVLRLSPAGRLLVAIATLFSFKTILAVYAGWLTVLAGLAAMPLFFAAFARLLERPTFQMSVVAGLAGALLLHSGHPQIPYYCVLFAGLWSGVRITRMTVAGDRAAAARTLGLLVAAAAVAVGLSAYLLVPIALDATLVTRGAASYDFFLGPSPFSAWGLLTLFDPEFFGTPLEGTFAEAWEYVFYLGPIVSLLALAGAVAGRTRPLVSVLLTGLLLSLVLAVTTPLSRLGYEIVPGYGFFRLPARLLFLTAFFSCCLAGVGLDEVRSALERGRIQQSRRIQLVVSTILIGLVAVEGLFWARRYLRVPDPVPFPVDAAYARAVRADGEPARIAPMSRSTPSYGSAAALGLEIITGYDPFNLRHYQAYMDLLQYGRTLGIRVSVWTDLNAIARPDMLAALNVRFIVSPRTLDEPPAGFVLAGSFEEQPQFRFYEGIRRGPVFLYRNERFLGRAFFAATVRLVDSATAAVREVERADLRETAVVEGASGVALAVDAGDRVAIVRAVPGELDLNAHTRERRFLVVSEVWHPGWHALVDRRPATLYRTDVALQGLWLEPGDHRVELRFSPPGLTVGLLISATTALVVGGLIGLMAVARGRTRALR